MNGKGKMSQFEDEKPARSPYGEKDDFNEKAQHMKIRRFDEEYYNRYDASNASWNRSGPSSITRNSSAYLSADQIFPCQHCMQFFYTYEEVLQVC